MIFKGSRYEKLVKSAFQFTTPDGRRYAALPIRFIPATPAQYRHTVGASDRLDLLANHFYRNPEKFWLIADANNSVDPEALMEAGRRLLVPPDRGP